MTKKNDAFTSKEIFRFFKPYLAAGAVFGLLAAVATVLINIISKLSVDLLELPMIFLSVTAYMMLFGPICVFFGKIITRSFGRTTSLQYSVGVFLFITISVVAVSFSEPTEWTDGDTQRLLLVLVFFLIGLIIASNVYSRLQNNISQNFTPE